MAADSALIKAALGEAVSRAGTQVPNLKPLYDSNVKATKDILGLVSGAMKDYQVEKEKLRLCKNAQLADFKKLIPTLSLSFPLPSVMSSLPTTMTVNTILLESNCAK